MMASGVDTIAEDIATAKRVLFERTYDGGLLIRASSERVEKGQTIEVDRALVFGAAKPGFLKAVESLVASSGVAASAVESVVMTRMETAPGVLASRFNVVLGDPLGKKLNSKPLIVEQETIITFLRAQFAPA